MVEEKEAYEEPILQEKSDAGEESDPDQSAEEEVEVQTQFVYEHNFEPLEIDFDFIKEKFGKVRQGGRVTPRCLYEHDLILGEQDAQSSKMLVSERSWDVSRSQKARANEKKIKIK